MHVAGGVDLAPPIHSSSSPTPAPASRRCIPATSIVVEREARASIIESYVTLAAGERYFTNAVTEVVVGRGAWLEHTRIQRESEQAFHVGTDARRTRSATATTARSPSPWAARLRGTTCDAA